MKQIEQKEMKTLTAIDLDWSVSSGPVQHRSYHELADTPVVELDALAQLESNVRVLEDLHGRLGFVMREVRDLLKI